VITTRRYDSLLISIAATVRTPSRRGQRRLTRLKILARFPLSADGPGVSGTGPNLEEDAVTGRQSWRSRQSSRRPPLRHAMVNRRRWYRIAAAVTAVVGAAALALGASGQLLAPAAAPSTAKAVLTQAASTQAVAAGAADDVSRRCARGKRACRRTRSSARCRSTPTGPPTRSPAAMPRMTARGTGSAAHPKATGRAAIRRPGDCPPTPPGAPRRSPPRGTG
jgi:hypothetical protein